MERASKVNLTAKTVILGNLTNFKFYLGYTNSGYQLEYRRDDNLFRPISPRLSGHDMMMYLDGMIQGVQTFSQKER